MGTQRRSLALVCGSSALALVVTAASARLTYELTDDELAGPEQPIAFSHQVHAGTLAIDCKYCHTGAESGQHATIPSVGTCMGCHQWVKQGASPGSAEEIAALTEYSTRGEPIPWVRIHNLPEHVQFPHAQHVRVGLACQECHGPVETMNRVYLVPDTKYHPSAAFLPAAKLEMGWCMSCHRERGGTRDCVLCHY
jgi:hypothetical protein